MDVAAAILAGGRGSRLGGVAKGLVTVGGEAMIARALRVLATRFEERLVVAGEIAPYARFDARLVADLHPGQGPLSGLEAALGATEADAVLILSCDLPFVDGALVDALRDAPDAAAVVARLDGRAQPLCARYRSSLRCRVREEIAAGRLRMLDFVGALDARYLDFPAGTRALFNVNTPADLARAEVMARDDRAPPAS